MPEFNIGDLVEVIGPKQSSPWVDWKGKPWMGRRATVIGFDSGDRGVVHIDQPNNHTPGHFTRWSPENLRLVESFESMAERVLGEDYFA